MHFFWLACPWVPCIIAHDQTAAPLFNRWPLQLKNRPFLTGCISLCSGTPLFPESPVHQVRSPPAGFPPHLSRIAQCQSHLPASPLGWDGDPFNLHLRWNESASGEENYITSAHGHNIPQGNGRYLHVGQDKTMPFCQAAALCFPSI